MPISFNLNVLSDFFDEVGMALSDLDKLNNLSLSQIRTLTHLAVSEGYRLIGEGCQLSASDIFAKMDMEDISAVAEMFANSLTPDNAPQDDKKEVEGNGKKQVA